MSATVWFTPMRTERKRSLITRVGEVLARAGLHKAVAAGDLVAVKMHFGETGGTAFIEPIYVREVVRRIKEVGGKPFLTDANTLYRGQRANAVDHIECALHNGFAYATVEAPIIIADGLDGKDGVDVRVDGKHFEEVRVGSVAMHADALVALSHFKGHEAAGFGGAIKNIGMGLGVRSAKQRMHADFRPEVDCEKCTACGRCVTWCPVEAIRIEDGCAVVDRELCYGCGECVATCPFGAIATQWDGGPEDLQEKMVEHAAAVLRDKADKTVCVNFVMRVSPDCDCWHFSDAPVVPDIGVLASSDPVAADQAALDLVTEAYGLAGSRGEGMGPGEDKFARITGVDGTVALAYAERMGLGTRDYDLRVVE